MIITIIQILFATATYLIIGAVISMNLDICDDDAIIAFTFFWAILFPIYAIVALIKTVIKLIKGDKE